MTLDNFWHRVEDVRDDDIDCKGEGVVVICDDSVGYCEEEEIIIIRDNGIGYEGKEVIIVHNDSLGYLKRVDFKDIVVRNDLIDDFGLVLCSSSSTSLGITR
ncbi:15421_t:CDS:2 [Funneliformis mosseae]|uniref:15421_t:CDS:1 n=1 Tax=Funneliformis mosseae TaxID=27381 RepID=A0A9N8Z5W8_FUNMO|nr:15421_t:CDS:2 [Funneliformis mosseae]